MKGLIKTLIDTEDLEIDRESINSLLKDKLFVCVTYNTIFREGILGNKFVLSPNKQLKELYKLLKKEDIEPIKLREILIKLDNVKDIIDMLDRYDGDSIHLWNFICANFFVYYTKQRNSRTFKSNMYNSSIEPCSYSSVPKLQCFTFISMNLSSSIINISRDEISQFLQSYEKLKKHTDWLNKKDEEQVDWAFQYIQNFYEPGRPDHKARIEQACNLPSPTTSKIKYIYTHLFITTYSSYSSNAEFILFLRDIKGAYSSKKYREKNDGKVSKNFKISKKHARQFAQLAQSAQLTHSQFLELMIERVANNEVNLKPRSPLLHEED